MTEVLEARLSRAVRLRPHNTGDSREAVADLLRVLVESTGDPDIRQYGRAISAYAEDLDRGRPHP